MTTLCSKCVTLTATHGELMTNLDGWPKYFPMCDECESNIADRRKRDSIPLDQIKIIEVRAVDPGFRQA
jgi:hypothetical protein